MARSLSLFLLPGPYNYSPVPGSRGWPYRAVGPHLLKDRKRISKPSKVAVGYCSRTPPSSTKAGASINGWRRPSRSMRPWPLPPRDFCTDQGCDHVLEKSAMIFPVELPESQEEQ